MTFKKGDIVRCIDANDSVLVLEGKYEVMKAEHPHVWLNDSLGCGWHVSRFVLFEGPTATDAISTSALRNQVGGDHYKDMVIQPLEFIIANNIPFAEGAVIKYVVRWRKKNGIEDLKKARQTLDAIIENAEKPLGLSR